MALRFCLQIFAKMFLFFSLEQDFQDNSTIQKDFMPLFYKLKTDKKLVNPNDIENYMFVNSGNYGSVHKAILRTEDNKETLIALKTSRKFWFRF